MENNRNIKKLENFAIPMNIADEIINELPQEMWSNPNNKFCYASIAESYIIDLFIDKLNNGLRNIILDDNKRLQHILNNMIYGITFNKYTAMIVKSLSKIKNIYVMNITEDDLSNMPKFDYIIQNPPYSGTTHLDFFRKGLDLLKPDGKMTIIEPSTWLINLKKDGAKDIKDKIHNHVYKVILDNLGKEFNVGLFVPCSITYIDMSKSYNIIDYICCGNNKKVKDLTDCNLIGDYNIITSIINKVKKYKGDKLEEHIYDPKKKASIEILNNKNNWYTKVCAGQIGGGGIIESGGYKRGGNYNSDSTFIKLKYGEYKKTYLHVLYHTVENNILNLPIKAIDSGKNITDNDATCLYDTEEHIRNWVYNVFNIKLLLFISICFTINGSNNIKDIMPWIVDKKYTDSEIYQLFGITKDEANFINKTLKKFERNSLWFKRYMCGPSRVIDEDVQKFMDNI